MVAAPAIAQTPQTGTAAPAAPPSGVQTPAPVPEVAPGVPAITGPAVVPEQIAPPGGTAGPSNATPFSTAPSALGGNQTTAPATPNLSK